MPLVSSTHAAYVVVAGTILIGMFFTRDDRRNIENILTNILSFAALLATIDFPTLVLVVLVAYIGLGVGVAIQKLRRYFFAFGSKTYGSLSLTLLLASDHVFGLRMSPGLGPFGVAPVDVSEIDLLLLANIGIVFAAIAVVVHFVSIVYFRVLNPTRTAAHGKKGVGSVLRAKLSSLWGSSRRRRRR